MVWYGMVWFGRNCEAEFKTINQSINESMNQKGGYRAARAAKKVKTTNIRMGQL